MAQLFNFKKFTGGNNITQTADNFVKRNTNQYGDVSDPQVYVKAAQMLQPYSSDLNVANKILDLQNQARKLQDNVNSASNAKDTQSYYLNEAKLAIAEKNYSQPKSLVFQMANLYNAAYQNYQDNVLPRAMAGLSTGQSIPADLQSWGDELKSKSTAYASLASSYTTGSGPENPDAYGVMIKTNPETGKIVNIDVNTVDSINGPQKGFIKSDSTYGQIPVYLNSFDKNGQAIGRIGNNTFTLDSTGKTLQKDGGTGLNGIDYLKAAFTGSTVAGEKEAKAKLNFTSLGDQEFDNFDVPNNSVLKDPSGKYYYNDASGKLMQVKDKNTLVTYLNQTGNKKITVDNIDGNAYNVSPDFISSKGTTDPITNKPRVLDDLVNPSPTPTSASTPATSFSDQGSATPSPSPTPAARQSSTKPPAVKEQSGVQRLFNAAKSIFTGGSGGDKNVSK